MQPRRNNEWVRRSAGFDFSGRSDPSASPAAPGTVSSTTAKALSKPQPGAALRRIYPHGAHPHAEAQVLCIAQLRFDTPTGAVEPGQILGRLIRAVGGQAPGRLHVLLAHTHHGAHLMALGGDLGAAQDACPPGRSDPRCRGAGLPIGCGDQDVAAKPDDIVEMQILGQQPVQLVIAEAAVGDDADLEVRRQDLGQPHQQPVLVQIALILQGFLVHRQPDQWCGASMLGDRRRHDGGLVVGIEVGPVRKAPTGPGCHRP